MISPPFENFLLVKNGINLLSAFLLVLRVLCKVVQHPCNAWRWGEEREMRVGGGEEEKRGEGGTEGKTEQEQRREEEEGGESRAA